MSINLKPDEVKLHPSFASIFHLTDDTTGHFVGAFALTAIGTAHSAGVKGYAFCQEAPDFISCPFVLKRTTDVDFIVGAIKIFGAQTYFFGVPAHLVKDFTGTSADVSVTMFTSIKVTSDTVLSLDDLQDTESCKLKSVFDTILKGTAIFSEVNIKDSKGLEKWCDRSYSANIKATLTAREKRACKNAKDRAEPSGDSLENPAAAMEAKAAAATLRTNMLSWAPYYNLAFYHRFIIVEDGKRDEAMANLEGVVHQEELQDALVDYLQMLDATGAEISVATTPFKDLLNKMTTPAPTAPAPRARRAATAPRAVFGADAADATTAATTAAAAAAAATSTPAATVASDAPAPTTQDLVTDSDEDEMARRDGPEHPEAPTDEAASEHRPRRGQGACGGRPRGRPPAADKVCLAARTPPLVSK